jgi:ATP-binding cassette subfamily F protein uup
VLRRELEWMRATPSARTGKSKSRIDRFYEIKEEARKRLEEDPLHLQLNPERLGGKVIELHKVRLAYGERVLIEGLTHAFKRGERIGIVGANGAGKSSLLDLIVGKSEPTGGKVVIGETVVFGHFHQHGAQFPEEMRVLEAVRSIAEFMPLQKGAKLLAADLLERFLFPRHTHHTYVRVLSGGEKKRLHLLQVLMRNPNVLILDEPTIWTSSPSKSLKSSCSITPAASSWCRTTATSWTGWSNMYGSSEKMDKPVCATTPGITPSTGWPAKKPAKRLQKRRHRPPRPCPHLPPAGTTRSG